MGQNCSIVEWCRSLAGFYAPPDVCNRIYAVQSYNAKILRHSVPQNDRLGSLWEWNKNGNLINLSF